MTRETLNGKSRTTIDRRFFGGAALALAITTLAITTTAASPAAAQAICAPHADLTELLGKRYKEQTVAIGIANNGRLMEVYSSKDGSTWTIIMTTPQGESCVVADGKSWDSRQLLALGPQV